MNNATLNKQNATNKGISDNSGIEECAARNLAHVQIQKFMDDYQKRLVGRLTNHAPSDTPVKPEANPLQLPLQTQTATTKSRVSAAKQDREKLHKIWLASKPLHKHSISI